VRAAQRRRPARQRARPRRVCRYAHRWSAATPVGRTQVTRWIRICSVGWLCRRAHGVLCINAHSRCSSVGGKVSTKDHRGRFGAGAHGRGAEEDVEQHECGKEGCAAYAKSTDCSFCSLCRLAAAHALLWTSRNGKDQCVGPLNS
jgi:hypothetical protein